MAKFEFNRKNNFVRIPNAYNLIMAHLEEEEPRRPLDALQGELNQFIGEPNTAVTRARIQNILFRWNYLNNENLTIDDLNIF